MKFFRIGLVLGLSMFATFLSAQTYQGRIVGSVTDASGALVSGAKVSITNTGTNVARTLTTNDAGEYSAPSLEPGKYAITVEAAGFRKLEQKNVELEVAKSLRIDLQLVAGATEETVEVTSEAPLVNTANAVLESTFTNNQIVQLPLQGRDFQNLVSLNPGVQRSAGGGFMSITANGNREEDNNFIVDGIDDNDAYYGGSVLNAEGVEGTPATHLPIDAIQEFNVSSSPEAEYGWKPGAIVNLGIKSGTNELHGTAYYFHRNDAFDARNYFNPEPDPISSVKLHQYGASLGGPIKRDKLFFFMNYEGVRDIVGNPLFLSTPVTVPIGDPTVSIPDAVAECQTAGTCNQLSLNLLPLFPTNLGTTSTSDPTLRPFDFNNTNREDNGIGKLDFHLNEKHSFSGRFFMGDSIQNEESANVLQPYWLSQAITRATVAGGTWSWTPTASIVNELRFGYNRFNQSIFNADHNQQAGAAKASDFGLDTGVTNPIDAGFPEIRIDPFNRLGGSSSWPLLTAPNQTYQVTENLSWIKGAHSLKLGGEFRTGSTDNLRDTYGKGQIDFDGLEEFVNGEISNTRIATGNSHRLVKQKSFGLFAQDEWRIRRRLTLTAGLRYDVSLPITEENNLLGNFDPSAGLLQVGKQLDKPYNTDFNNFAPRLGFSWDVFGNSKTVLRGGGGIIYEIPHISLFISQNSGDALGLATIPTGAAGVTPGGGSIATAVVRPDGNWAVDTPVFGDIPSAPVECTSDSPCSILGVDRNIKTPYVANWTLNLQQQFGENTSLQVAYVGNRGIKLYSIRDINQNDWTLDWEANGMGDPYYDTDGQSGRPFTNPAVCGSNCLPYLSNIDMLENKDYSFYHGLQVTLRQRAYKGLDFVAGYTWAHSIDIYGSNRAYTWENANDPLLERGDSSSDIRNRFTLAMTYAVPRFAHYDGLLGGWTFNTIVNLETGVPHDLYDGVSAISGTYSANDRWNMIGDGANLKWGLNGVPFIPEYTENSNGDTIVNPTWQSTCGQYAPGLLPGVDPGTDYPTTSDFEGGCYAQNGTVLVPAQWGQFGNMRRNAFRGPGYSNVDMSVGKTFNISERIKFQLRGEVFNIFNHPNFAGLTLDLSSAQNVGIPAYTPDVASSNPVVGSGGSRHIQIGAKIIW
ncbi:MAG TPA: TonB-dependent receptor [Terriglobales bacterium]|nr:TonB-dependent receptor [Terriglobales bacterium]